MLKGYPLQHKNPAPTLAGVPSEPLLVPERLWRSFDDLHPVDDLDETAFYSAIKAKVVAMMSTALASKNADSALVAAPLDPNRIFGFGYSNGGMNILKLAADLSDEFAALFVMSGSIGCKRYATSTTQVNTPASGSYGISLFALHGTKTANGPDYTDGEGTCPPGDTTHEDAGASDAYMEKSPKLAADLVDVTGMDSSDAEDLAPRFYPLRGMSKLLLTRNHSVFGTFPTNSQTPTATTANLADVAGGTTSTLYRWNKPLSSNPQVIEYRDPELSHTNWPDYGDPDAYLSVEDLWTSWFSTHPRVQ